MNVVLNQLRGSVGLLLHLLQRTLTKRLTNPVGWNQPLRSGSRPCHPWPASGKIARNRFALEEIGEMSQCDPMMVRRYVQTIVIIVLVAWLSVLMAPDLRAQGPVPRGATAELVVGGFQFVEGPLWKDGVGLFFSDMGAANITYKWSPDSGAVPFLTNTEGGNGLTFDHQGRLVMAQQVGRKVIRVDSALQRTVIADTFRGKKLNSPNDVVVKSDGAIFFTDPPFGIQPSQQELPFSGVYRISPAGILQVVDTTLSLPNGIAFSPDESKLYVNDSQVRKIYVWDVVSDSLLVNKRLFATIKPTGYADGMKVDPAGNVFCAGPLGIWVFSPSGVLLDTILVPSGAGTTNCNWGDSDRKTLYITSGTGVYRIRLSLTDINEHHSSLVPNKSPVLLSNYPNPFNATTAVQYTTQSSSHVMVEIIDVLGRKVATLVNRVQSPGHYTVRWDAADESSGMYIVRVLAGDLTATRNVMLLR